MQLILDFISVTFTFKTTIINTRPDIDKQICIKKDTPFSYKTKTFNPIWGLIYFLPTGAGPVRLDFLMSHFKALWVPHNISNDIRRLYWDKQAGKLTHHLITPLPSFPCLPPLFCILRLSHFCILLQEIVPQFLVTTSRSGGRDLICWFLQQQLCFDFLL